MFHLLQQKKHNVLQSILLLIGASIIMHLFVLVPVLISRIGDDVVYKVAIGFESINLSDVMISYMPEPSKAQSAVHNVQKAEQAVVVQKKVVPKKAVPKKAMQASPKTVTTNKSVKKVQPKPVQKPVIKKSEPTQKKQPIKKEIVSQKSAPKKEVTPQEYTALELQAFLQEALQEKWHPPAGLPKDLCCEILIAIDNAGKAMQCELIGSSGVLIYDVHVQSTLLAVQYPREVWDKKIEINFACA